MPFIVRAEYSTAESYGIGATDAIADATPEEQLAMICGELARPVKPETVRRKLTTYWPTISSWRDDRPDLFDAALYAFVTEIEARHASEPDGIRHLRDIASTEISEPAQKQEKT